MKDVYEVLHQKEADLARVRREIESLHVVASVLSDDLISDELTKKEGERSREDMGPWPRFTGDRNRRSLNS